MSKTIVVPGRMHSTEKGNVLAGANEVLDDTKGKKQNVINSETDAELLRLDQTKQDNLTFDNTPTEDSTNPVTSGGVFASEELIRASIEAILILIPSAASELNKLVDTNLLNSSIGTATATFRGTSAAGLTEQEFLAWANGLTHDLNDYVFWQTVDSDGNTLFKRYKWDGTQWLYEYTLNNSSFTAAQWAAIQSGITAALVEKLSALPTAAALAELLAAKQDVLTFDNNPTSGSSNPVKSGGVYTAISNEATERGNEDTRLAGLIGDEETRAKGIENGLNTRLGTAEGKISDIEEVIPSGATSLNQLVDTNTLATYVAAIVTNMDATFNITTTDGHITLHITQVNGIITSVQVQSSDIASAAALTIVTNNVSSLTGRMVTAETNIANLQQLYNSLQQSAPQVIQPTDTWPVANPSTTVIYRVIDRTNTPPQYYSDYMWNGTGMVLMATYNNAIDEVPTPDSNNLVKSGGVSKVIGEFLGVTELGGNGIIPYHLLEGGFFTENGSNKLQKSFYTGYAAKYTDLIPVSEGDQFYLIAGDNAIAPAAKQAFLIDSDKETILGSVVLADDNYHYSSTVVTIPSGVSFVLFQGCYMLSQAPSMPFGVYKIGATFFKYDVLSDINKCIIDFTGYWKQTGVDNLGRDRYYATNASAISKQIMPIPCKPGDIFIYNGVSYGSVLGWSIKCGDKVLVEGQYIGETEIVINDNYIVDNVTYVPDNIRFSSFNNGAAECTLEVYKKGTAQYEAYKNKESIKNIGIKNLFDTYGMTDGKYINDVSGALVDKNQSWAGACVSGFIPVANIKELTFKDSVSYFYMLHGYDASQGWLRRLMYEVDTQDNPMHIYVPDDVKYIRFCWILASGSYDFNTVKESILAEGYCNDTAFEYNLPCLYQGEGNPLWGKTWVACGDSLTDGDFSSLSDPTQYQFQNSPYKGEKMVYPFFIGRRNNMNVFDEAISGSTMALTKDYVDDPDHVDKNTRAPFSNLRYKADPSISDNYRKMADSKLATADYITLWFGTNDATNTYIGTIDDNTNETFYGAWNVVLEYLINQNPFAKIGIIVPNLWITNDYKQAIRAIAKKWGISYLDLPGDPKVPALFDRDSDLGYSAVAQQIREDAFVVSPTNGHPNAKCHEYESYVIESWLKSL